MTLRDHTEKRSLRQWIRTQSLQLSNTAVLEKSRRIHTLLFSLPAYQRASLLVFYMAVPGEVQTEEMVRESLQQGKSVAVPCIDSATKTLRIAEIEDVDQDLCVGHFGILEPCASTIHEVPLNAIDVVIVPGVAFDRQGGRLGRGGGYYDRFLASLPSHVQKIGLAFAFQVVPYVPQLPHDVAMDMLVTEEGVICCQKVRAEGNIVSPS